MTRIQDTVEQNWKGWIDRHPAPNGWKSPEFDVLAENDAPVTLFMRIWKRNRRTIEKYLAARKKEQNK